MEHVFVTVALFKGEVEDVKVFDSIDLTEKAEDIWLIKNCIENDVDRKRMNRRGNRFQIFECRINNYNDLELEVIS